MKLGSKLVFFILLAVILPITSNAGQLEDGTAAMESGDYQTAYKLLYPLAEQGDPQAQDCIGSMYLEGLGVEKDEIMAADWYAKSAEQGYAMAQNTIGAMYVQGLGVEEDRQKGLSYIMKAAKQGLKLAQQNAYGFLAEEVKNGNIPACHNLGYMCLKGWGGEAESQECMKLLEYAAQNGYMKSASALSQIYTNGMFGVEPDEEKAAFWNNFSENPVEAPADN